VTAPKLRARLVCFMPVQKSKHVMVSKHREHTVLARELHDALRIRPFGHEIAGQNDSVAFGIATLA
jgi:hypothetical protein